MAISTLSHAGPRASRRLLGAIAVLAVALVVSLVLLLSFGGPTSTRHAPALTHEPAVPTTATVSSGPDGLNNQATQTPDVYQCRPGRPC
jgi:hypothetical protein